MMWIITKMNDRSPANGGASIIYDIVGAIHESPADANGIGFSAPLGRWDVEDGVPLYNKVSRTRENSML